MDNQIWIRIPEEPSAVMKPQPVDSAYENGLVSLMFVTWGVVFLDRMAQLYLMPYIAADLRLSDLQIGELASTMAVCWAVSTLVFGAISDRVGRKVILTPLVVAFSLLSCLSGLAQNFRQLLTTRALMGVAEGPCWSVMNALVEQSSTPARRGRNVGIVVSAAALIGLGVAPVLTTQIAAHFGWRAAFFVVGLPGLVLAAIIARFVKEPPARMAQQGESQGGFLSLLGYRNIWLCAIAAAGYMTWLFLQNVFAPLYMTRVEHLDPRVAGLLMGAAGLGSFLLGVAGPALSDRMGRRPVLLFMALLSTALPIALTIHSLYANLWLLGAILFFTQGGQAITALSIVLIPADSVPPRLVGAAIGLVTLVGELLGGMLAPTVAGEIAQTSGLQWTLWMAAGGSLLVFVMGLLLKFPDRSDA
jgi:predicted MFS family arabinose efflux permease